MITAEELVLELSNKEESENFKLATVVSLFGNNTAKIQFDGEDTPSEKQYAYLESYKPTTEDRVLLGALSGTYVILGKVNYNVSPPVDSTDNLDVEGNLHVEGDANVSGDFSVLSGNFEQGVITPAGYWSQFSSLRILNDFRHQGSSIGFFGQNPTYKRTVSPLPDVSGAPLLQVAIKMNDVVNALRAYGLL